MFIKGFDKDLKCRGYQFEIGKDYKIENNGREIELCTNTCFHFCDSLQGVHSYYGANEINGNRFCEIEVLGKKVGDGEKFGSDHIRVVREIVGDELKELKGLTRGNTGLFNSGNRNSGDSNSGNWNSGYSNSGNWNSCGRETGFFNSIQPKTVNVFNKPCDIEIWEEAEKPSFFYFALTTFISSRDMTDLEKENHPEHETTGGYLKTLGYKEAFKKSYNDLSDDEREKQTELLKALPNFDADVFFKISGIKIE